MAEGQILTSDIIKDDNLDALIAKIKALDTVIASLTDAIKKNETEAAKLEASTKGLSASTVAGRDAIVKNVKATDELERANKAYQKALSETNLEVQNLRAETALINNIRKNEAKLAANVAGSYNALSAQYSLLKIRINALSKAERENTEEGKALVAKSKEIYDEMKRLQEATGKTALNVGNYKDALGSTVVQLEQVPGATGKAVTGVKELGSQFKRLLANPIVLLIAAIVAGLALLGQAFSRSERGAQLMAKATGVLEAVMSLLVKAANIAVDALISFSENPLEGFKKLGKAIVDNILNRLLATSRAAEALGRSLASLISGDLEGAKKAFEDAGKQVIAFTTGLDPSQQAAFASGLKEVSDEVQRQTALFIKLADAKRSVSIANRELVKQAEKLQTIEELQKVTADDATKSFAEREAAAEKSRAALEARAKKEIQIARNNLGLINQEIDLRKANGEDVQSLLDSQLSSYQAFAQAERAYTLAVRDNEKQRSELKQDRLEKDLDILIDGFDNQKTVNERLLQDDRKTIQEKAAIYEDTVKLANDSFAKQIETIQQFTGIQVDANDLIATSDAVVLNQKIRSLGLSEIIEGRLLEIVRERRLAVQDLADAEKALLAERNKGNEKLDFIAGIDYGKKAQDAAGKRAAEIAESAARKAREALSKNPPTDIYSLLGINVNDSEKDQIKSSFDFAKQQLTEYLAFRTQIANRNVQNADREVQAAQAALDNQITLQAAGLANTVQARQKDLDDARKRQQEALKEQERVAKQERLIAGAQQGVNMALALSKLFATNPILAIGLGALVIGSFVGFKIAAANAAKKEYGQGDFQILEGGSHASGNDIPLGTTTPDGRQEYAEGGEARIILPKSATAKYRTLLPEIFQALKQKDFENQFQRIGKASQGIPLIVNVAAGGSNISTERMERTLDLIHRQGQEKTVIDGKGRRVVTYKNLTQIFDN